MASESTEPKFRYKTLAAEVRSKIYAGIYRVGDKLETVEIMMAQYGAARSTVSQAMRILEEEGLLVRGRGKGTFVADRARSGEVAIILESDCLGANASPFYGMCIALLMGGVASSAMRWRTRLHLGKRPPSASQPPEGMNLLDEEILRDLRGVLTFHPLFQIGEALQQRRIPVILLSRQDCGSATHVIWFDADEAYRIAMAHLKEVGCRSVGAVWDTGLETLNILGGRLDRFRVTATEAGLATDANWLAYHPAGYGNRAFTEKGGWTLFRELWSRPGPKPDAIFIDDEYVCRGVLRAAMELGIRVGQDIKLLTIATEGLDLPCSIPVTRIDNSITDLASTAILSLERLIAGELPAQRRILLPPRFKRGQTT